MASWTEIEYLRTMNQTFYDQVKTADQKAGQNAGLLRLREGDRVRRAAAALTREPSPNDSGALVVGAGLGRGSGVRCRLPS